jgi:TonB family protein
MKRERSQKSSGAVWGALGISVLVHLVVLLGFFPPEFVVYTVDESEKEKEEFRVETIVEPSEPEDEEEPDKPEELAEPDEKEPEDEQQERVEEQDDDKPEEKDRKFERIDIDRKVVTQKTNDEAPEEAEYLSQRANKTDEETRARETTTKEVHPGEANENVEQASVARGNSSDEPGAMAEKTEIARRAPAPKPEPRPEPRQKPQPREQSEREMPQAEKGVQELEASPEQSPMVEEEKPAPEELFEPDVEDYNKMFAEADEKHRERVKKERNNRGRSILGDWREREKMVKGALENHISEVKPGNHTSVNAKSASYAQYVNQIHRKIHARWGASFLPHLDTSYPMGHPLNNPDLHTKLEFVIQSPSGTIESINIVESSGELMYDAEALSISYTVGPHPNPPAEIVSPDGKVYVHWNFWRDQRQCGTFGASIYIVDEQRDRGG